MTAVHLGVRMPSTDIFGDHWLLVCGFDFHVRAGGERGRLLRALPALFFFLHQWGERGGGRGGL